MSSANNLVNPAVSASGEVDSLLIEKFDGQVKLAYTEKKNMMQYFDLREVTGTNSVSNKYMGETGVQALAPGKDPKGQSAEFDKNRLVIDTTVISRNNVGLLADVQDDIMTKGKLAVNQVQALLYLEDRMLIQQLSYSSRTNTSAARSAKPRVRGHGFSIEVVISDDQAEDPNSLLAAIEFALEQQLEQNVPVERMAGLMPYKYFNVLRDAERIINATYVTVSDAQVKGFVLKSYNLPIVPTNQFPNRTRDQVDADGTAIDHHLLSNPANGNRYDIADADLTAVCILFGDESLMVGRSISLQGKIWFNDSNKTWYIDSWMAEGAIPDRWEQVATVRRGASTNNADVVKRANRKAMVARVLPTS